MSSTRVRTDHRPSENRDDPHDSVDAISQLHLIVSDSFSGGTTSTPVTNRRESLSSSEGSTLLGVVSDELGTLVRISDTQEKFPYRPDLK